MLVFGYLGPLALVSLLASRREFVKWHAKQGLILSSAWILLYLVMRYLNLLLDTGAWVPLLLSAKPYTYQVPARLLCR